MIKGHSGSGSRASDGGPQILRLSVDQHHSYHHSSSSESPPTRSLSLSGDDVQRLTEVFEKVTAGGRVIMPMEKQMWGDVYGLSEDRYGIQWHCNLPGDGA